MQTLVKYANMNLVGQCHYLWSIFGIRGNNADGKGDNGKIHHRQHRTHCRCGLSPKEARDDGKIPQARRKRVTLE